MERAEIVALISLLVSILLIVKLIRMQASINELRYDVARLEGRPEAYSLSKQAAEAPVYANPQYPLELAPELEQRLQLLLASGKKVEAIKQLKDATGLSLKAAKDYVDAMRNR
ncbi:ribosomal protein L7/L12 [Cohnella mopanensis]|uniref:ribosomal protein L7/L12 n=1 Tax=Cohnella mopanensis TaxID=2911966 RepID=UPI001EF92BAE|nr:ribosomal protein L7/L12 [Cohnella mopanensis]